MWSANGKMTQDDTFGHVWDAENRLTAVIPLEPDEGVTNKVQFAKE